MNFFVIFNNSPMIIASGPILTSDYKGPSVGTMIIGRYLDDVEIGKLEK